MGRSKGSVTVRRYWRRHAVSHVAATRIIDRWIGRDFIERTACDQAVLRADLGAVVFRANVKPTRTISGGRDGHASPVNPAHLHGADEASFHPTVEPTQSKKQKFVTIDREWVRNEGDKVAGRLARLDELLPTHPARRWLTFDVVTWLMLRESNLSREYAAEIVAMLIDADPTWEAAIRERRDNLRELSNLCIYATGEGVWWTEWRDRIQAAVNAHDLVK